MVTARPGFLRRLADLLAAEDSEPTQVRLISNTGDATATGGGYANTGVSGYPFRRSGTGNVDRSTDPQVRALIADEAARLSVGPDVVLPREVANYVENLIIRIFDCDALHAIGHSYDDLTVAGARKAISDAIAKADRLADPEP